MESVTKECGNNTLDDARNLISAIKDKLNEIYAIAPSFDGNSIICDSLFKSKADFIQAAEKLEHPALRIATIGTTSAGKSTLVNALIGRQIAPMDAGELSAGVLHLVHSQQRLLHIEPAKDLWDAVHDIYLDDKSVYDHIRENIFKVYHKAKKERTISTPVIRIEGPLLPAAWTDLLELPYGVGIEIFDLPGLNSTHDTANLKVIQDYIKQCFSLVVMHYSNTDTSNRAKLLKEVKEVVEALGGKTDAMLFVLNGVNLRNETDDPLENRLNEFAAAIQLELGLLQTPKIIPIDALALFYSQCAWGWSDPVKEQPTTVATLQTGLVKAFNKNCANFIKKYQKDDPAVKTWFRSIEDAIEENSSYLPEGLITAENIQQWFYWSFKHSGGLNLWRELRQRVNERFAEIVIAPTLIQPLASLETLLSILDAYSKTQRLTDKDQVVKKKEELEQQFEELRNFLEQESQGFEEKIRQKTLSVSKAMESGKKTDIDAAIDSLFGLGSADPEAAEALRTIVRDIKNDLTNSLIITVRDYHNSDIFVSTDDLKENLNKTLSPENCNSIAKAAERYRTKYDISINGYDCKVLKNSYEEKKLRAIENAAHILFKEMRKSLTARATYILQTRNHSMQKVLEFLLKGGMDVTERRIYKDLPDDAEAILAIYREKLADVKFEPLPDDIFALREIKAEELIKIEKTGTETIRSKEGSCFKTDHTEQKDLMTNVSYVKLRLPNIKEMADMWMEGVSKAEALLWKAVGEWFSQSAGAQNILFQESLKEAQTHLVGLLNQRLAQSEADYQHKLAEIEGIEKFCNDLKSAKDSLRASGSTSECNNL